MGKRIGFMLASIHMGSANKMWHRLLELCSEGPESVFVFPGGRLNFPGDGEHLRNSIYALANSENLDGLISWTSSLTGTQSASEVADYLPRFFSLPFVSLGLLLDNVPSVGFDAYSGMTAEVRHFILAHKSRHIAFIRGPENHKSAEERFQAYKDCLKSAGIAYDPELVSSPRPWAEGREALLELVKTRALVPGLDFDALVCASDLLMTSAEKQLLEFGVDIPTTVRIGGFNDSDFMQGMDIPPTTVRMPIDKMASVSFSIMNDMLSQGVKTGPDVNLPSDLVIRRSCGCMDTFGGREHAAAVLVDEDAYIDWVVSSSRVKLERSAVEAFIRYALKSGEEMVDNDLAKLSQRFNQFLLQYYLAGGSVDFVLEAVHWALQFLPVSPAFRLFILSEFLPAISRNLAHAGSVRSYEKGQISLRLDSLKNELLAVRSLSVLPDVFYRYLPKLGFSQAFLVIYIDDSFSRFAGGYSGERIFRESESFMCSSLLPESIKKCLEGGLYVVEPLFIDVQELGYLVLRIDGQEAAIIEDIRASLSSAIKGITLLDIASRARENAEKAERSSAEFFANVSEGLREPLSSLHSLLARQSGSWQKDAMNHLVKAEHLLDLTLSQKGEMELQRTLFDIRETLSAFAHQAEVPLRIPSALPVLYADRERLLQVLEILVTMARADGGTAQLGIAIRPDGLSLEVGSSAWSPAMQRKDTSLSLAECIVMLHSGSFHYKEHSIVVLIPWPTLSGEEAYASSVFGTMLFVTGTPEKGLPEPLRVLPQVAILDENSLVKEFEIPDNAGQIAWDAGESGKAHPLTLNLLKNHQKTRSFPFLCFGAGSSALDLWATLESQGSKNGNGFILSVGPLPPALGQLSAFGRIVTLPDATALLSEEQKGLPALIVLPQIDRALVDSMRQDARYAKVPVLIVQKKFEDAEVASISEIPGLIICNTAITEAEEFLSRLVGVFGGEELLPPLTGSLVKKAIAYLNRNATSQISRWQLAEAVNISEDYLTRIFRKDIGISPWDYLNRYRIQLSCQLLMETGETINEIASKTGFQDQAYFCRVFKKVKGVPPGHLRSRSL